MNISKNSFYVFVLKYCLGCTEQCDYPKTFCTLMWCMIFGVLLAPVLIPYIFVTENMFKLLNKILKNKESIYGFLFFTSIVCSLYASYFLIFVNADDVKSIYLMFSIFLTMIIGIPIFSLFLIGFLGVFIIEPIYCKFVKNPLENSFIYNVIKSYKDKTCKIITYEE